MGSMLVACGAEATTRPAALLQRGHAAGRSRSAIDRNASNVPQAGQA